MNRLVLTDIEGFLIKKATKFGNGAKVDCPRRYLGKTVYLVVVGNGSTTKGNVGARNRGTEKRKSGLKGKVRRA